jgi:hypothetical protein
MMYERMPRLTAEERLARLARLDASAIRTTLADAARTAGTTPFRIRIGMLGWKPVFRLEDDAGWTTVFADSGERLEGLSAKQALDVATAFFPEHAATMSDAGRLEAPDQWTLDGGLPRFLPMRRIAFGDADGTHLYISERVGEPVMKTTARGRLWGYMGAVMHWTYFTPFRQQRELWRYTIIYAALVGSAMCLSGLVVGVWRFSPRMRYRLKRQASHSPYAGFMWWHHYAGLLFGFFTFTWVLSGALSLTPWDWVPSTSATLAQREALSGGELQLSRIDPAHLREGIAALARDFGEVKELEVLQFRGRPFALAYRAPGLDEARRSGNPEVSAIFSPQLVLDHRIAWIDVQPTSTTRAFESDAVLASARAAMPGRALAEVRWLDGYDAYYYDKWNGKPLPVLRVKYRDPEDTWLYIDPGNGLVSLRHTRLSRVNRWMYNGLHSFDFPFLYYSRPAWDIVLVALSAGGIALSITTIVPAWRRLRRHVHRASRN